MDSIAKLQVLSPAPPPKDSNKPWAEIGITEILIYIYVYRGGPANEQKWSYQRGCCIWNEMLYIFADIRKAVRHYRLTEGIISLSPCDFKWGGRRRVSTMQFTFAQDRFISSAWSRRPNRWTECLLQLNLHEFAAEWNWVATGISL